MNMSAALLLDQYDLEQSPQTTPTARIYHGTDAAGQAITATVFNTELIPAETFITRFEDVVEILANLQAPQAVAVLNFGTHQGQGVVIQAQSPGESLAALLAESEGLPLYLVLDIVQQMGEYLHELHQAGIVHGGLQPETIYLSPAGIIQIQNAGIAYGQNLLALLSSEAAAPQLYQAPEVRAGNALTPQSDFYALGTILYQAISGLTPPFDNANPYPGSHKPGLPPELDELVARCLAPDPPDRYATALSLLQAVEAVHRGQQAGAENTVLGMEDALVGHTLGAYQLIDRLGQGGMATVYRAYEPALDRYVAVKVLPQIFANDPNFMQRFRREARVVAQLNHPNIVPIYHYGEDGGITYLVMRFVEGGTLTQARGEIFAPDRAIRLLIPVAKALAYAHQQGVVHRDIKPGNVLLSDGEWPLLADFGLAKMAAASTQLTQTGVGVGTPMYMSPEQCQGNAVDQRTDIYALGIMLYEMVTGEVPFRADTPMGILIKHISAPMPPPRQVNPAIPEVLERIILKATAKSPEHRFQTAVEMATALEQLLERAPAPAGEPGPRDDEIIQNQGFARAELERELHARQAIMSKADAPQISNLAPPTPALETAAAALSDQPPPPPPAAKSRPNFWQSRGLIFAAVGLPVIIILGVIGIAISRQMARKAVLTPSPVAAVATLTPLVAAIPVETVPTVTSPPPTDTLVPTATVLPTETPAPRGLGGGTGEIAFVSDRGGTMQIYILAVEGAVEPSLLAEIPGGACQPAWSPDGRQIVFVSPCAAQDETYPDSSLHLINADGSGWMPLSVGAVGNYDPVWSPDGTQIAFTTLREGLPQNYLYSVADQTVKSISSGLSHDFQPAWSPDGTQIAFISTRIGGSLVFVMAVPGTEVFQFSRDPATFNTHPRWSPDGNTLLYMQLNNIGNPILFDALVEKQGFSEQLVTTEFTAPMRDPAYSPDSFWVTFSSNRDGINHDIWMITASGVETTRLTTNLAYDFDPAWRP
jgi:eukaryotic-like serine/threonine-protein kinase